VKLRAREPRVDWPAAGLPAQSLLWRVFSTNAVVLIAAVLVLALSPITVGWPVNLAEGLTLLIGLGVMLGANLVLMRRALGPLGRLWDAMCSVDPLHPGHRIDVHARSIEVAELNAAFNGMLDRLEAERQESSRRTQAAQEAERRWLSMELHDEIGQSMTALLLQLDVASRTANAQQQPVLRAAEETVRDALERVRAIVRRLRPEGLDDLGLHSALVNLCDRLAASGELEIGRTLRPGLPTLTPDAQVVVYRIAQECLTNVMRHSGARRAEVELDREGTGVRLRVCDDGGGLPPGYSEGSGIRGMRERALMIGSTLRVGAGASGGTEVVLDLPAEELLH
jgi:two-component system sensor histidine kinase UhpB